MKFCQNCGERPSSFVFETSSREGKFSICLCDACAKKLGLVEDKSAYEKVMFEGANRPNCCPTCHTTEDMFKKYGYAGCKNCYYAFGSAKNVVENWQGTTKHKGKTSANSVSAAAKMEILMTKFKNAISRGDFHEATKLKKEIQQLGESGAKK